MSAKGLADQAERTLKSAEQTINDLLRQERGAEAKVAVADAQRDLRDIKRQLADEQREVRAGFTDARRPTVPAGDGTHSGQGDWQFQSRSIWAASSSSNSNHERPSRSRVLAILVAVKTISRPRCIGSQ